MPVLFPYDEIKIQLPDSMCRGATKVHLITNRERRNQMKLFATALMTILVVIALSGAYSMTAQAEETEQLRKLYSGCIVEAITRCQSKSGLVSSKSENLRTSGLLARQKAVFLTDSHDVLVEEMVANDVGTRPYQIDYYLNRRFHENKNLVSGASTPSSNE
jgi:hypothetical protein